MTNIDLRIEIGLERARLMHAIAAMSVMDDRMARAAEWRLKQLMRDEEEENSSQANRATMPAQRRSHDPLSR